MIPSTLSSQPNPPGPTSDANQTGQKTGSNLRLMTMWSNLNCLALPWQPTICNGSTLQTPHKSLLINQNNSHQRHIRHPIKMQQNRGVTPQMEPLWHLLQTALQVHSSHKTSFPPTACHASFLTKTNNSFNAKHIQHHGICVRPSN